MAWVYLLLAGVCEIGWPLGLKLAVWTGIGAAGTALIGMAVLGEPREVGRILCVVLILSGVVGLKVLG